VFGFDAIDAAKPCIIEAVLEIRNERKYLRLIDERRRSGDGLYSSGRTVFFRVLLMVLARPSFFS
jgi:hypothetical protein